MESKKKRNLLIGLIILLLLINLSALVTFSYNKFHHDTSQEDISNGGDVERPNRHERIKQYVRNELALDDNQFHTYCRLKDENMQRIKGMIQKIHEYKRETILEINKEYPDTVFLLKLADSIAYQNKLIQIELNRHFLEIKNTLTPEQKEKFIKLLIEMDSNDRARKNWRHRGNDKDSSEERCERNRRRNWGE